MEMFGHIENPRKFLDDVVHLLQRVINNSIFYYIGTNKSEQQVENVLNNVLRSRKLKTFSNK